MSSVLIVSDLFIFENSALRNTPPVLSLTFTTQMLSFKHSFFFLLKLLLESARTQKLQWDITNIVSEIKSLSLQSMVGLCNIQSNLYIDRFLHSTQKGRNCQHLFCKYLLICL